jgi:hypothetical protein
VLHASCRGRSASHAVQRITLLLATDGSEPKRLPRERRRHAARPYQSAQLQFVTTGLRAVPCGAATYCGRTHVQPTQHGNEARASDVAAPHPSSLMCVVACLWYCTEMHKNHSVSFVKDTMELENIHNRPRTRLFVTATLFYPLPHLTCALPTQPTKIQRMHKARMMDGAQEFRRLPRPPEGQRRHESRERRL